MLEYLKTELNLKVGSHTHTQINTVVGSAWFMRPAHMHRPSHTHTITCMCTYSGAISTHVHMYIQWHSSPASYIYPDLPTTCSYLHVIYFISSKKVGICIVYTYIQCILYMTLCIVYTHIHTIHSLLQFPVLSQRLSTMT